MAKILRQAIAIFEEIAEADPDRTSANAWINLADSLGRMGRFLAKEEDRASEAKADFERAIAILTDFNGEGRLSATQQKDLDKLTAELKQLVER